MDDLKSKLDEVKKRRIQTYKIFDFALDTARTNQEIEISGSYLYVSAFDGTDLNVRLNELENDLIPLRLHRGIHGFFYRIFITHAAQVGKSAKLVIGVESEFFVEDWA